jgi:acyl-CoA oxidase
LRKREDHSRLPGIQSGDLGSKMGYNSKDNGWLSFDNVRIPRKQMLMKYSKVDRQGNFSIEGDIRALYSIMMFIRIILLQDSGR